MRQRAYRKTITLILWLGLGCYGGVYSPSVHAQTIPQQQAHIGFLDKITGHIQNQKVRVGDSVSFGSFTVWVRACYRSAPGEPTESVAFFEIMDRKQQDPTPVFSGWMFASTPSLASLEHPVYDLWLISCPKNAELSLKRPEKRSEPLHLPEHTAKKYGYSTL